MAATVAFWPRPGPAGTAVAPTAAITPGSDPVAVRQAAVGSPDRGTDRPLVAAVFSALQDYWTQELPEAFPGKTFQPLAGGYVAVDSSAAEMGNGGALCIGSPAQITGNAFYCPGDDGIVYDSSTLVPVLLGHYGPGGLMASLAHEYGHAIAARIGPTEVERQRSPATYPSILIEAQGDCYAGGFLAWAAGGNAPGLVLPNGALVISIAPLLDFRDPADAAPGGDLAHGLGLDRLRALLVGYRSGPAACHAMTVQSLAPTLGRPGLRSDSATPRYPTADAALVAARPGIWAAAASFGDGTAPQGVSADPADLRIAAPYGQFASAAALALAVGRKLTGTDIGAACFTGVWTASVFGKATAGALGSWQGDADEAMDLLRNRPGVTFAQLTAFADGFDRGRAACRSLEHR